MDGSDVLEWQQRETGPHAQLILGELALAAGVPCVADAAGFNRHTFLCGQSGSGKTYSLGVILERLLTETDLENVLSQADNLVLMRLNSLADAAFAQAVFSFVPPSLIERSATFRQGEALIAGKISPRQPALLRFG
ncbi:MAG: helicase HerA domain-containing protein, partial [Trebonia sp.]